MHLLLFYIELQSQIRYLLYLLAIIMLYTPDKPCKQTMNSTLSSRRVTSSPNLGIIIYKKYLTDELAILRLKPEQGRVPDFQAGQFVALGLDLLHHNKITYRAYSIASPPEEKRHFEFYIKMVTDPLPGQLTTAIFNLKERDRVYWCHPAGFFTLEEKKNDGSLDMRRLILVASGTGLAPFISYTLHLKNKGTCREIILMHGVKYATDLGYREILENLQTQTQNNWNFKYVPTVSRPDHQLSAGWNGNNGRVESLIMSNDEGISELERIVGERISPENSFFHICGYQGTIDAVVKLLTPAGFVTNRNKRNDGSFDIKIETYGS
jgi:ferredoxin/flavodoxin---NADP+ reductase